MSTRLIETRPAVALINNSWTPYRLSLHRRIRDEITQAKFHSVFTHEQSNSPWRIESAGDLNSVSFGSGERSDDADRWGRSLVEWRKGKRILQWIDQNAVRAVVLGGYNDPGRWALIAGCRSRGIPCFLFGDSNIRCDTARGFKALIKARVIRWAVKSCYGIMPCGELGRQYFTKYGANPSRIYPFPYEPDYQIIQTVDDAALDKARTQFSFARQRRRLVYSGRLIPIKRVDLLIDAFTTLASRFKDWDLVIVGGGPLLEELQRRVPVAMKNRVQWIGFVDDQQTMSAIYRCSEILVLPSDCEPWGVVINEAVAAGMAVIASENVGAAYDLVEDGVNGRIFPPGNLQRLVEILGESMEDQQCMSYRSRSAEVLDRWRKSSDPVAGLRCALSDAGVISMAG